MTAILAVLDGHIKLSYAIFHFLLIVPKKALEYLCPILMKCKKYAFITV